MPLFGKSFGFATPFPEMPTSEFREIEGAIQAVDPSIIALPRSPRFPARIGVTPAQIRTAAMKAVLVHGCASPMRGRGMQILSLIGSKLSKASGLRGVVFMGDKRVF
jgi:hypothetical protein